MGRTTNSRWNSLIKANWFHFASRIPAWVNTDNKKQKENVERQQREFYWKAAKLHKGKISREYIFENFRLQLEWTM